MHVAPVSPDEYPELVEVWEASVRATHTFLTEEDIRFFKPLILNVYLPTVSLFCVKDSSGIILGFLGVAGQMVEMLFLKPKSRGQGLGKLFLTYAVTELQAKRVDVNEQNPGAVGFYEHMGFEVVGRSPVDGMGKPFPLLHMRLKDAG